jgi:hypothetical protein
MTPFPKPLKQIRSWLAGYATQKGIRIGRSDWNNVWVNHMASRSFVEEHLLGVKVVEVTNRWFRHYKTQFPDRFYLELVNGQHVLIIKDLTVKKGRFLG